MVARYLIAGAISAALAGGAVWMGAEAGELGFVSHPHKDIPAVDAKEGDKDKAGLMAKDDADAASTSSSKDAITCMTRRAGDDSKDKASPSRSYGSGSAEPSKIRTYEHDASEAKRAKEISESTTKRPKKAWLDDYLKPRDAADGSTKEMDDAPRDSSPMRTTIETIDKIAEPKRLEPAPRDQHEGHGHGMASGTATYRVERKNGMTMIIERDVEETGDDEAEEAIEVVRIRKSKTKATHDTEGTYSLLLDEAAKLEIEDMRDDAYLNIIDFALGHADHDRAEELVDNLSTPELRDTARQRIGVSHARSGHLDGAFALIDELEVKELTDAIRLEFIRAASHQTASHGRSSHQR